MLVTVDRNALKSDCEEEFGPLKADVDGGTGCVQAAELAQPMQMG